MHVFQESESEEDSDDRGSRRKSTRKTAATTPKATKVREDMPLKKRLHLIAKGLIDYVVSFIHHRDLGYGDVFQVFTNNWFLQFRSAYSMMMGANQY